MNPFHTLIPTLLVTLLSTLSLNQVQAQTHVEDPFIIEKMGLFNTTVISKSGFKLMPLQIVEYMAADENMRSYSNKLGGIFLVESLFNATGSILTVWPLVQLHFLDKSPNKNLTWIGLGAVTSALITRAVFMKKAVKAARFYNNGYSETPNLGIDIGSTEHGIGLLIRF